MSHLLSNPMKNTGTPYTLQKNEDDQPHPALILSRAFFRSNDTASAQRFARQRPGKARHRYESIKVNIGERIHFRSQLHQAQQEAEVVHEEDEELI